MELDTVRQIRGAKELVEEAIDAATLRMGEAQRVVTSKPYAVLAAVPPIAGSVRAIEEAHLHIVDGAYFAIRLGNRLAGLMAGYALDRLEEQARGKPAP
jgi:hypothetical protein